MANRKKVRNITSLKKRCSVADLSNPDCCWRWKLSHSKTGEARISIWDERKGKHAIVGAPLAVAMIQGKPIPTPCRSWTTCGNTDCCNPRHCRTGTPAEWGEWVKESGAMCGSIRRKVAAAAHWRKRSPITLEIARQIRASSLSAPQEAKVWTERLGRLVSDKTVYRVRQGSFAEPNPFSGLVR